MIDGLWLVHPDEGMCAASRERFAGLSNVRVIKGLFEHLDPHDCFVTAGNDFGLMSVEIDAAVVRRFGEPLMERVQQQIMNEYLGKQPVGMAFIVPTGTRSLPFLCHAPTMRVPGSIAGTDKVYAATWAALLAVAAHNRGGGDPVGIPAMGTGFGGVSFDEAARQMAAAYRHLLEPPHRLGWDFVIERQRAICYDGALQVVT